MVFFAIVIKSEGEAIDCISKSNPSLVLMAPRLPMNIWKLMLGYLLTWIFWICGGACFAGATAVLDLQAIWGRALEINTDY